MRALAVIPARLAATRLPNKPLADLCGRPVVEWIHRKAVASGVFDDVVVATPDQEILEIVRGFGGQAALTSSEHETGTDRVAEVAERESGYDVVANIQGDQPFVTEELLDALVSPYRSDRGVPMTTVAAPLDPSKHSDEHTVKVLVDRAGDAVYFSRAPVPHGWLPGVGAPVFHHLGLYAFAPEFLRRYANMEPTPLERLERLEQLRALEHGVRIRVSLVRQAHLLEVNTPEDLVAARDLMATEESSR